MFTKNSQSGFTLIELLVVVAIIGILSSIVLAALGSARQRARDTAAIATLSQVRAQAELDGNFAAVCSGSDSADLIDDAFRQGSITKTAGTTYQCNNTANAYFVAIQLNGTSPQFFCVDSSGFAGEVSALPASTATACN